MIYEMNWDKKTLVKAFLGRFWYSSNVNVIFRDVQSSSSEYYIQQICLHNFNSGYHVRGIPTGQICFTCFNRNILLKYLSLIHIKSSLVYV